MDAAVRVLAFAGARDVLGAGEVALPLSGPCTAAELLDRVCARYPGLIPYKGSIRVAVNGVLLCVASQDLSCEARQREAGWWAHKDSNLGPAD